ncbi:MAG TPA: hypothetical protein VD902_02540 [Symbiobacteriaceae bacterium]|nr:hypothetical protein [Symbiobacteriaceae bacterium]
MGKTMLIMLGVLCMNILVVVLLKLLTHRRAFPKASGDEFSSQQSDIVSEAWVWLSYDSSGAFAAMLIADLFLVLLFLPL